ncbi:MalY/PatB family protein [Carboxylicivirga linearis]|uniref:cysteine-S-conjugate beta-lyase n=1 Tax=Carboxylicivirga linearis TaxID=1628157 RepID=A0ABS5JSN8_9BACT|nr:MalY/PatB family protein [Carboxylicivirga linearis]MBS2097471.1 pyridoxal phosphate-dependent aminotransferase [Carboxylicivirga linearis]
MYDFDRIIDRSETNTYKFDLRKSYFGEEDVIPLWVADMDFAAAPEIHAEIQKRAAHEIFGYTIRKDDFNEAIKDWCEYKHAWKIQTDCIEYSPGVVPALAFSILGLTEPGDGVIINTPVYPPFHSVVTSNGRELIKNSLIQENGKYVFDFDSFEQEAAKPSTKLFILCNPHNPVGRAWTKEELLKIHEICIKHNVVVLADEIHSDLVWWGKQHNAFALLNDEAAANSLTFMAPSKTFNIAGFNTSYVISSNPKLLAAYRNTQNRLQVHLGHVFSSLALTSAYNLGRPWLKELTTYIEDNIQFVDSFLKSNLPEIQMQIPDATYLLWLNFAEWNMSQKELKDHLVKKAKVGLNDGMTFGAEGKGYMRLNVASPRSILHEALERIVATKPV